MTMDKKGSPREGSGYAGRAAGAEENLDLEQTGPSPEAASGESPETPEQAVERLAQALAAKSAEAEANYDRFLRERAELENFKKRVQRERAEAQRFAAEQLVRDLLPIIDNLERAVEHAESGGNGQPLVEGVRLVLKSALDVLERHGVTRIEAAGARFDPELHEAIARIPDAEREPNQVVQQFQAGYRLHDRLLRPAQVSVSGAPVEKAEDDD
jgi:molecular chaperone GrpE